MHQFTNVKAAALPSSAAATNLELALLPAPPRNLTCLDWLELGQARSCARERADKKEEEKMTYLH